MRKEVLRAIYVSPFFAGEPKNFESAVSEISNIGFLKEAGSHVAAYDLYLDQLSECQFSPSDATVVANILDANAWAEELIDLADHQAAQGKLQFATRTYRRALEISPQNPNVHYGLGIVSGKQGAWETAEKHFARATKLVPSWVSPWLRLSVALRKLGKDKEASKIMARARALDKKGDEIHRQFAIANILEEDGRVEEAVEVYKTILADAPQSSQGWWLLGKALNQGGRSSEAKAAHERAVELSPYWASPHFGLAESLQALDDLDGAEKAVRRTLELSPGFYDAHVTLGHILTKKQLGKAETQLRESLSRFPNAARLHSYLGSILNRRRKNVEAETEFRTAIQLKADYEQAFVGLAMALRVQGKLDEAIEANKAAININPGFAEAYFGLAMCHQTLATQEALIDAIDELTLAERSGYSPAKVSYEKAKIFCRLQYFPDALVSLKKAKQHGFRFTEAFSRKPEFASLVPLQDFKALYEQSAT